MAMLNSQMVIYHYIWVNNNISLTWIKAILGWFPLLTMIPVRSRWGRYNLPRSLCYVKNPPSLLMWKKTAARPDAMRPRPAATAEHRRKLRTCALLAAGGPVIEEPSPLWDLWSFMVISWDLLGDLIGWFWWFLVICGDLMCFFSWFIVIYGD